MKVVQVSESAFTVQGHGVHTAFTETVAALKKQPGVSVLVNTREPADIRHIHTIGAYALGQLLFGKGKKVVSAHLVPDSLIGSLRGAVWWKGIATWYLKVFYNRANRVIAVSDETKHELERIGVKAPIEVVYNMVDTDAYARTEALRAKARAKLGIASDDWVVVSNGQVQPRKRVDTFLECARQLPDVMFIWVGGIPFKAAAAHYEVMKKLMTTAPPNVRFTGVVSLDEVKQYLHASDVFMMPSEQETFGLAIVEAAASGLPVLLRDIPDYDHTFRAYARLCNSDESFVRAIRELRGDPATMCQLQAKSAQLAAKYDSQIISKQLVKLYENLLKT